MKMSCPDGSRWALAAALRTGTQMDGTGKTAIEYLGMCQNRRVTQILLVLRE